MGATVESRAKPRVDPAYVFELPVRLAHWTIVLSVVVLALTGTWMGRGSLPDTVLGKPDMITVRAVHYVASWVLFAAVLARVAWFFLGNRHASIREWIPSSRERLRELGSVLRFYASFRRPYPEFEGHNPLAGLAYVLAFLLLGFMVSSGAALRSTAEASALDAILRAPVRSLDLGTLHLLHRLGMYAILAFVALHLGLIFILDAETRGGIASAMFSGWRRVGRPRGGAS